MNILAFDTSTDQCSCALLTPQGSIARSEYAPRRHAELLLPMADELLAQAGLLPTQLDAVAFGRGPGSFTGLRIACGVAQGIAVAADIPVLPVSSLATLAQAAWQECAGQVVLSVLDARMEEVYWGCFSQNAQGLAEALQEEALSAPAQLHWTALQRGAWCATGTAWAAYPALTARLVAQGIAPLTRYPQAQAMLPLAQAALQQGRGVPASAALPVYLRNHVVQA